MNRDEYAEALKRKIDDWNEQIGKTEVQMKEASADAQARYAEQIAEMRNFAAGAEEKMQDLVQSHSEEWEKHREKFEKAWDDIAAGFGKAWSRFH